jgi:hypothetical protein
MGEQLADDILAGFSRTFAGKAFGGSGMVPESLLKSAVIAVAEKLEHSQQQTCQAFEQTRQVLDLMDELLAGRRFDSKIHTIMDRQVAPYHPEQWHANRLQPNLPEPPVNGHEYPQEPDDA